MDSALPPATETAAAKPRFGGVAQQRGASSSSSTRPAHNAKYYLPDSGMAIFQVEQSLYKVHRHLFIRESDVFKSMFECPPSPSDVQDGNSDDRPIYLPEVTCAEFEALLDFFYYGMFKSNNPLSVANGPRQSLAEQPTRYEHMFGPGFQAMQEKPVPPVAADPKILDLLSISLRFAFDNVASEVTKAIDSSKLRLEPVAKVLLALKHESLKHWVSDAFDEIVNRTDALTKEEIVRLGANRTAIVCKYREDRKWDRRQDWRQPTPSDMALRGLYPANVTKASTVPADFYLDD